jgi:glycosyltransferase involved in cell wall biosynthesis
MLKLSIIIPTLGRKQELFNTISDLSHQVLPKELWEIIVVFQNQADIDIFKDKNKDWGIQLKLIYSPAPNASLARNIGLIESKGEIVLFLDDDLKIENHDFLTHHLNAYNSKKIAGVFGQVTDPGVPPRTTRHKWSYKKHVGWMFFPPNYDKECYIDNGGAGNLSVRRDLAMDIGGMDIKYEKGAHREESDFCLRLTREFGKLFFEPKATVVHLGAAQGGCRSWGKNDGVHPFHHVFGEWYFILKGLKIGTVKWYQLHYHLGVLFLRQIWNKPNRHAPDAMVKAILNSINGFFYALLAAMNFNQKITYMLPPGYKYQIVWQSSSKYNIGNV